MQRRLYIEKVEAAQTPTSPKLIFKKEKVNASTGAMASIFFNSFVYFLYNANVTASTTRKPR